ncbi:WD repeat-containing protein slp1 [Microbotryomycetes sp. JL221]|nr:WD repeat-containing protein slp1 [Microbotryomycetes sp. JL221]
MPSTPSRMTAGYSNGATASPSRAPLTSLAASLNTISLSSPGRATAAKQLTKQQQQSIAKLSSAKPLSSSQHRSSRHASPSKHHHSTNATSRRSSPTKHTQQQQREHRSSHHQQSHHQQLQAHSSSSSSSQQHASLAATGGVGRAGVVKDDYDLTGDLAITSSKRSPSKKGKHYDRYIPSRSSSNSNGDHTGPIMASQSSSANNTANLTGIIGDNSDQAHTADLSAALGIDQSQRILSFFAEPPMPQQSDHSNLLNSYARLPKTGSAASASSATQAASRRRVATAPERVLDAPGLVDDYYLNLLDWSSTNLVAIGLGESVYIWNAESGDVSLLCSVGPNEADASTATTEGDEYICSLKFTEDGSHLAVGLSSGPIQVYDVVAGALVRTMSGHLSRVPALSWSGAILSSGSRTGEIWNSDVRIADHKVATMRGHRGEVCGLEWRPELAGGLSGGGQGLLASGGNDNVVNVWDGRMTNAPKMCKTNHTAAVKALAWCPWNSTLLATGGGTSDKTIHFWNTTTSARLNSLITSSQVTSLVWSPHSKEILSSHGIPDHQLTIWSYPALTKIVDIPQAHDTRILHSCLSPDGSTIATASSDENLKFWKVFDVKKSGAGSGSLNGGRGPISAKEVDEYHGIQKKGKTGMSVR